MADPLDEIRQFDTTVLHAIDLLTQVDQKLNECKLVLERLYGSAPPATHARIQKLADAIKNVEPLLGQMVGQHNVLVGELNAFESEVKEHQAQAGQG